MNETKLSSGLPEADGMTEHVRRACMRYVQNRAEADDLTQDILIKVFRGGAPGGEKSWWVRVAANHCLDHLRKEKRRASRNAAYASERIVEQAWEDAREDGGTERPGRLERLRARLGESDRRLLHLRFDLGLRQAEIAEILGVTRARVGQRLTGILQVAARGAA